MPDHPNSSASRNRHRRVGWIAAWFESKSGGWAIIRTDDEQFFAHNSAFLDAGLKPGTEVTFTVLPKRRGAGGMLRATEICGVPRKENDHGRNNR